MRLMKATIGGLILATMALTMCSGPDKKTDEKGTVFRYNEAAGISSLDPAFASNLENIWALNMLYNGLVQMDDNMQVQPCIANSWDISNDGRIYTFHLRTDVFFHDHELFPDGKGRQVVAYDFVRSFLRIIDPNTASPGAYIFANIDRNAANDYLGFKAEDDQTLQIYLAEPNPAFLEMLTMQFCSVVPDEAVDHYGLDFRRNPVGTGPFTFTRWKEGVKLVLSRNENYFETDAEGNRLPYLDGVAISFTKDRYVAFLQFLQGDFDFMSGLDRSYRTELITNNGELKEELQGKFVFEKNHWLKTDYLGFLLEATDSTQALFADKNLRIAINYALNREEMVKHLRNNIGTPAHGGFIPPGFAGYDKMQVIGYHHSTDLARQYLKESDYEEMGSPTIMLKTVTDYIELVESIQYDLQTIGINTEIDVLDASVYRVQVANSHIDFFRKSWLADYVDPMNFLQLFYSGNYSPEGPNYTHFSNETYDELFLKAKSEHDADTRFELFRQMDSILVAEAPIAPLYYDQSTRFIQSNVTGLKPNAMNLLNLNEVRIGK